MPPCTCFVLLLGWERYMLQNCTITTSRATLHMLHAVTPLSVAAILVDIMVLLVQICDTDAQTQQFVLLRHTS